MNMTASHRARHDSRSLQIWIFLLYVLFVIYGSLVPLRFVNREWTDAMEAFRNIPFLDLGIHSRADWVANFLLFIPLTFLAGLVLNGTDGMFTRVLIAVMLTLSAWALAVGIEFTQLFFPQRTVSQNDILAEGLGGIAGTALHLLRRRKGTGLARRVLASTAVARPRQHLVAQLSADLAGFQCHAVGSDLEPGGDVPQVERGARHLHPLLRSERWMVHHALRSYHGFVDLGTGGGTVGVAGSAYFPPDLLARFAGRCWH
jgi:glycopeptide antibiotics resistance protein